LGIHQASAMLVYQTPLELYNNHELAVIGKIISLTEISKRETIYNIKVEEYLKNPKPYDFMDAYGLGAKNSGIAGKEDTIFEIGDRVLLYLYKEDGKYKISHYSFIAPKSCEKHQLLELPIIPGEPRSISSPANDPIHLTNTIGTKTDTFVVNEEINIDYYLVNNKPRSDNVVPTITIMTDSAKVFRAKQSVPLEPCTQTTISYQFTPEKTGDYTVNVTSRDISASTDFHVRLNRAGGSIDNGVFQSPLKQFKYGISTWDVRCKEGHMLITKATDYSPACVRPLTYDKLVDRGWVSLQGSQTVFYVFANDTRYEIPCHVTGWKNKVLNMTADMEAKSFLVTLQTKNNGGLTLTLPKSLLDSKTGETANDLLVLMDGEEVETKNETGTITEQTLTIRFLEGTEKIEIIASYWS